MCDDSSFLKKSVQVYGKKKNSTAIAVCMKVKGEGCIRVNGRPLSHIQPSALREKVYEPIHLLGASSFNGLYIKINVRGGGSVSQLYAVRQAIAKSVVAYRQKYVDEMSKRQAVALLCEYDRSMIVADPRRCEPKKFGGPSARTRYQKSYR